MFGVYSDKRLSKKEQEILNSNPDDYNWYCVIVQGIFKDRRFFQVRDDIELSQDDKGSVLVFEGGDIVYIRPLMEKSLLRKLIQFHNHEEEPH